MPAGSSSALEMRLDPPWTPRVGRCESCRKPHRELFPVDLHDGRPPFEVCATCLL